MARLPMYVVEAFTSGPKEPFSGNLAGVCVLQNDDDVPDDLKQKIAAQMNLPITAFIAPGCRTTVQSHLPPDTWTISWFTPTMEAPLCGHATFASAYVIFKKINGNEAPDARSATIAFETRRKGQLQATIDWNTELISLNFPVTSTVTLSTKPDTDKWNQPLMAAVIGPDVSVHQIADVQVVSDRGYLLYRLRGSRNPGKNQELLRAVRPDFQKMLKIKAKQFHLHSVTVTVQGWSLCDQEEGRPQYFSRVFLPWAGINEDSVTGSVHTMLAPYWMQYLHREQQIQTGKRPTIRGRQLSQRGGEIQCTIVNQDRILLTGHGRLSLAAEFCLN